MGMEEKETKPTEEKKDRYPLATDAAPIVTKHQIKLRGKPFSYTVTSGMMPLTSEYGEVEAGVFYMAYAAKPGAKRPLMFSFNGGPGSASVWLHLGALGPKRIPMMNDGELPPPPYKLVDNEHTWLEHTDLVFIDPVGTGYSRPATKDLGEKFWGLKGDVESVGEFIRLFLTRHERWSSPLYMVGESYGTTRAAGLAGHLIDQGIAFNGIVLVSSILNFLTARFMKGNDLPYVLFLPTYTATAWYHKKLPADLQKNLKTTLEKVKKWAANEYTLALAQGDALSDKEKKSIVAELARFTGLKPEFIANTDLRVVIHNFCKELLRDEGKTVGRLDSRIRGFDELAKGDNPEFDPSMAAIRPPYTAAFNDYVRKELGYKTDVPYHILGALWDKWNWGEAGTMPDTSEALRQAFAKNPHMRVFVANGFYDLATPFFATEYTLAHMGLDPTVRDNVTSKYYEAGHMMYTHTGCLKRLKEDVAGWLAVRR